MLFTSGGWQRCVFSQEGRSFCHEEYFRMYLPREREANMGLYIECLIFMEAELGNTYLSSLSPIFFYIGPIQISGRDWYI